MRRRIGSRLLVSLVAAVAVAGGGVAVAPSAGAKSGGGAKIAGLASGEPLKVGVLMTFSGPVAEAGNQQLRGLKGAVEDINADGGVGGHRIEIVQRDDGGDPNRAVNLARELVEQEKVKIIFGTTLSTPALAILPYLTEQKVLLVGSASVDQVDDPKTYPYAFTGSPVTRTQADAIVKAGQAEFKPKKVGLLLEATAYGDALYSQFRESLEKAGIKSENITIERHPQGATTVEAQMASLRNAGVDVVYHGGLGADSIRIPRTAQQVGLNVPLVGNQGTPTNVEQIITQLGGADKAANVNAIYFREQTYAPGGTSSPEVAAFWERMSKAAGRTLVSVSQEATFFDLGNIVGAAIEKAKTLDPDRLRKAIEATTYSGVLVDWDFARNRHSGPTAQDMVLVQATRTSKGSWERTQG